MTITVTPTYITTEIAGVFPLTVSIAGVGEKGAQGSNQISIVAGENISGHSAIYVGTDNKAYIATPLAYHPILGITTGAVSLGGTINVQWSGILSMIGWNFIVDKPVFVLANGQLSTTQDPLATYSTVVGISNASNSLVVEMQPQIKLA
jgi:hypothetical protein